MSVRKRSRSREKQESNYKTVQNYYSTIEDVDREDTRKRVKALLKSYYNYTDDNNPFGDPELSKQFIWHAKVAKLRNNNLEPFLDSKTFILKLKNAKPQIESIRVSRMAREETRERGNTENLDTLPQHKEEAYQEWKLKDEKFHLAQEKLRTEIRIKQGREKPVDFIHKVLMIWKGFFNIPNDFVSIPEYQKPYLLYDLLDTPMLLELYRELKTQLAIDIERLANKKFVCFFIDIASNFKQSHDLNEMDLNDFIVYWNAMIAIIESYVYEERSIKNIDADTRAQIEEILQDKTIIEFDKLEIEISNSLEEQVSASDIQFWNNVLSSLRIHRCKMELERFYKIFEEKNHDKLLELKNKREFNDHSSSNNNNTNNKLIVPEEINVNIEAEANLSPPMYESDEELRRQHVSEHDYLVKLADTRKNILALQISKWQRSYSNTNQIETAQTFNQKVDLLNKQTNTAINNTNNEASDSDEEEMNKFLASKRKENKITPKTYIPGSTTITNPNQMNLLLGTVCYPINTLTASRFDLKEDEMYDEDLKNEMMQVENQELGNDETIFNDIVQLNRSQYSWQDKYQSRKPRYFNRVRTGYEWNKYHQAHYDYENPPPRVIQGYKFNIFYPDLIDKTKSPQYALERSDVADTCIIRFFAGPPYEDIAFKIVNREWDMNEKAGFKNVFDRGTLYLYFNFKRYRYKR